MRKNYYDAYVFDPECICDKETVEVECSDNRTRGELMDDRLVKWFDDTACIGATINESFLQKDLEKVIIEGKPLSAVIREKEVGTVFHVSFQHVEPKIIYTINIDMVKIKSGSALQPTILDFKKTVVKKVKATD